ncbi:MAG: beta-lactamase family protein [Pseudohongiella sp.]|nr:beta-lactamase family protein [Pseudohongiella sp.]
MNAAINSSELKGHCDNRFARVIDVLEENLSSGDDLGASFAMTLDGEMVVDLWGGYLDEEKTLPWQEDSIVNVYSTTKTMSFLCALILADRGLLDFDKPVVDYWPEFAQNGKEEVLVWHIMDHAAGLSGMDEQMTSDDLYDWNKITSLLGAQAPWWKPGSGTAYHALTQGYLIGELVSRITGQSIGQFFHQQVATPLDADFFIGVPENEFHRIGNMLPAPGNSSANAPGDPDSIAVRTFKSMPLSALDSRTKAWRMAEIPAANGHGNARSVAKIHAALACGGEVNGTRLFSEKTAKSVMQERISATDMALGIPLRFGLGFGLNPVATPISPNKNVCYWGGWGGSVVIIDQDARASMSFVMNKMHGGLVGDARSARLLAAVYAALA